MKESLPEADLKQYKWQRRYATSSVAQAKAGVDLLRGFYVPLLLRTVRYDRVAGYFRSSALAAASRGFTALIERGGKARLIVGCDLAPHDIQTILDGSTNRLEEHLSVELDKLDTEPSQIRTGVELLAYMLAQGHLEIQVAFRRNALTGEPILLQDSPDGYVHEKWGIVTDGFGNRLSFSGSMNESATALLNNAENLSTQMSWTSQEDAHAIEMMETDFDAMWQNRHPNFVVSPIPEAVRLRLISISNRVIEPKEMDGKSALIDNTPRPSAREWLRFALIKHAPQMVGGDTVGIYTAPVKPWPHQEIVARRLVRTYPYGYMLCDEVGLGKTIETGLALRALWLSGKAKRILVTPPASLVTQWQRELSDKFLMNFGIARSGSQGAKVSYIRPEEYQENQNSLYDRDLVIVSTGLVQRKERVDQLIGADRFDVALVDEAHFARRQGTNDGLDSDPQYGKLYKAIRYAVRERSQSLWLATATPMQMQAVEAYDLADLIGRLGCFASEQSLVAVFYEILARLIKGVPPTKDEADSLRTIVKRTEFEDESLWKLIKQWLIDKDPQLKVVFQRWIDEDYWPSQKSDQKLLLRLLFAISPLQRVMMRHTRSLLEQYRRHNLLLDRLAQRIVLPIPQDLKFRQDENYAYQQLKDYCDELQVEIGKHLTGKMKASLGFYLSLLQQRFASSAVAIRNTMNRRLVRVEETIFALDKFGATETDELKEIKDSADFEGEYETEESEIEAILKETLNSRSRKDLEWEKNKLINLLPVYENLAKERPTKTQVLLRIMNDRQRPDQAGRYRQTVVFTRYSDTLDHLVDIFRTVDPDMRIGTFSGDGGGYWDVAAQKWEKVKLRDQIKHRFLNGQIDLLLCTDAAAEGLNLQTADLLVNYDLPWNPMKVEQRIGRIDRIGQRYDKIEVLNLATLGSVEEQIYGRLWNRLRNAAGVVGKQQFSVLPLLEEDFQNLGAGNISHDDLEKLCVKRMEEHNREIQQLEVPPEELYQIFNKELRSYGDEVRIVTLEDIELTLRDSDYLKATKCETHIVNGHYWFEIKRPTSWGGIHSAYGLTASQDLYERGVGQDGFALEFASYGSQGFDDLVDTITDSNFQPDSVKVVTVSKSIGQRTWKKSGILAMIRQGGQTGAVQIKSFSQLRNDIELSAEPVPAYEVEKLSSDLEEELDREIRLFENHCEMLNRHHEMGNANKAFLYLLAIAMLRSAMGRKGVKHPEKPNQAINEAMSMAEESRNIIFDLGLNQMPLNQKRDLIVKLGAEQHSGQWKSTPHFRRAAMHVIKREFANIGDRRRGEVTTDDLIDKLQRRVDFLLKT